MQIYRPNVPGIQCTIKDNISFRSREMRARFSGHATGEKMDRPAAQRERRGAVCLDYV